MTLEFDLEFSKELHSALKENLEILLREKTPADTERFDNFKKILIRLITAKIQPQDEEENPSKSCLLKKLIKKMKKLDSNAEATREKFWRLIKDYLGFLCSVVQHVINEFDGLSDELRSELENIYDELRDLQSEAARLREELKDDPQAEGLLEKIRSDFLADKVFKLVLNLGEKVGVSQELEEKIDKWFDDETPFEISALYRSAAT